MAHFSSGAMLFLGILCDFSMLCFCLLDINFLKYLVSLHLHHAYRYFETCRLFSIPVLLSEILIVFFSFISEMEHLLKFPGMLLAGQKIGKT